MGDYREGGVHDPTSPRPICATCPYWDENLDDTILKGEAGACRRHAPRPILELERGQPHYKFAIPMLTLSSDWCGEHPDFPAWICHRGIPAAAPRAAAASITDVISTVTKAKPYVGSLEE